MADGEVVELSLNASGSEDDGQFFTVDDAIEAVGFGSFQYKLLAMMGACWAADGMEMMILFYLSQAVACDWSLSPTSVALVTTVVFIGIFLGSFVLGNFSDRFGRRPAFLFSSLVVFVAGMGSAFAPSIELLYLSRFIVGIGVGGGHIAFTLFAEFLPMAKRARFLLLIEIFWALGTASEALLAWAIMPVTPTHAALAGEDAVHWLNRGWRFLLMVSAMPALLLCLFYRAVPESPRFLLASGRPTRALEVLQRASRDNGRPLPLGQLRHASQARSGRLADLFAPAIRRETVVLWLLWFIATVTYYGFVLLVGQLFLEEDQGTRCPAPNPEHLHQTGLLPALGGNDTLPGATFAHMHTAATSVWASVAQPATAHNGGAPAQHCSFSGSDFSDALISTAGELPGILLTMLAIDRLGRRRSMMLGFTVLGLATLPLGFCMARGLETFIMFVARASAAGVFQVVYIYTVEVYATNIRSTGVGSCSAMARLGGAITPFAANVLVKVDDWLPILLYAFLSLFAAGLVTTLRYETRGAGMDVKLLSLRELGRAEPLDGSPSEKGHTPLMDDNEGQ